MYQINNIPSDVQCVFIMIGINDFGKKRSAKEVLKNYVAIIQKLKMKKMKIFIQSTLYVQETMLFNTNSLVHKTVKKRNVARFKNENRNYKVRKLNHLIKNYISKHSDIQYIDLNLYLSENNSLLSKYTYDGVHLNHAGYLEWVKIIKEYIFNCDKK